MQPAFDMDALRAMVVGTELGSFARAASKPGRSQSAVSMQLKKLEQQCGRTLFRRNGRGLAPTEAGDALLAYARRIVALNDEAATYLGATSAAASVRLGLPQDYVEDILPGVMTLFARLRPEVHLEVHSGRNYALADDVREGRLDVALAFARPGGETRGTHLATLPMLWLGQKGPGQKGPGQKNPGQKIPGQKNRGRNNPGRNNPDRNNSMPSPGDAPTALVLFDHPCLFRQTALQTLEEHGIRWRLAMTTPSLPGVWAALRAGHGISVRTPHRIPDGIADIGAALGLPKLPMLELRLHSGNELAPAADRLRDIPHEVARSAAATRLARLARLARP
jgi:DNA-binding transcriptional LysR family regulator